MGLPPPCPLSAALPDALEKRSGDPSCIESPRLDPVIRNTPYRNPAYRIAAIGKHRLQPATTRRHPQAIDLPVIILAQHVAPGETAPAGVEMCIAGKVVQRNQHIRDKLQREIPVGPDIEPAGLPAEGNKLVGQQMPVTQGMANRISLFEVLRLAKQCVQAAATPGIPSRRRQMCKPRIRGRRERTTTAFKMMKIGDHVW